MFGIKKKAKQRDEFIEEVYDYSYSYGKLDLLTEEEVAVIAAEAYLAGLQKRDWDALGEASEAYYLGFTDGMDIDLQAVATEAYESGEEQGFIDGICVGFEDGFDAGSSVGYGEGYDDSQREFNVFVNGGV